MERIWFNAKTYGWGWTPAVWQGWLVVVFYVAAIAGSAFLFLRPRPTHVGWVGYISSITIATAVLITVGFKTGEKPYWR